MTNRIREIDDYMATNEPSLVELDNISKELDALMAQDREWLQTHPLADEYWRPMTQAEADQYGRGEPRHLACGITLHFRVNVLRRGENLDFRTRYLAHRSHLDCPYSGHSLLIYGVVEDFAC